MERHRASEALTRRSFFWGGRSRNLQPRTSPLFHEGPHYIFTKVVYSLRVRHQSAIPQITNGVRKASFNIQPHYRMKHHAIAAREVEEN